MLVSDIHIINAVKSALSIQENLTMFIRFLNQIGLISILLMINSNYSQVLNHLSLQKRQETLMCPNDNWKLYDRTCYRGVQSKLVYKDARIRCKNNFNSANMATIASQGAQDFITRTYTVRGGYWIGLKKLGTSWHGN